MLIREHLGRGKSAGLSRMGWKMFGVDLFRGRRCSLKGCERVAGGRRPPDNVARSPIENLPPLRGAALISKVSGCLLPINRDSTTGYFLADLRAARGFRVTVAIARA